MGFAGQVFAARVAVGLAMPSPKAFSQAGALIGGFASNMYKKLNKDSVTASQRNLNTTTQGLKKAREAIANHASSQGKFLDKAATGAIGRLRGAYKGLGKSAMASASAMKNLRKSASLGKGPKMKLFANVTKDLSAAQKYQQMMKNFIKLKKTERTEIMLAMELDVKALQGTINTAAKREKLGEEAVQLIKDEVAQRKAQLDEFKHYDKVRVNKDTEYNKKAKKLKSEETKAEKDNAISKRELIRLQEHQLAVQKKITAASQQFVFEMKTNFTEAIRESVSALTAFYYKLNQNTQELISFERELLNANSVFRVSNDELFEVGNTVVQFGQEFGLSMQNGATGLYQLASAGLSASESMEVLTETLKLSMAVQGDHNTISKLVTQTLFGFDMEMNQAAEITDKFAYAIQKSLIEYQDLASAVKFALPFFTTTGQSIDQLLGALQVLTNRALEAGIAGRGLRQGVAELAESIGDATANFRQFGVEVTDNEGNMLQLTEIAANFHKVLDEGVINDTELLTTLIQDLNVRGATAFVHLVQASDEFTDAVEATASAGGELDEMVKIQNESMSAQIQILANNVDMMFMYRDSAYEGTRFLNGFHEAIVLTVEDMRDLIVTQQEGEMVLTAFGLQIQEVAIEGIQAFRQEFTNIIPFIKEFVSVTAAGVGILKVYLIPLKIVAGLLNMIGPTMAKLLISFHLINKVMPLTLMFEAAWAAYQIQKPKYVWKYIAAKNFETIAEEKGYIVAGLSFLMSLRLIHVKVWLVSVINLQTKSSANSTAATWADQHANHASTLSLIWRAAVSLVVVARDKMRIAVAAILLPIINANLVAENMSTYATTNSGKAIAWKTSLMLKEFAIAVKNMVIKKLQIFWDAVKLNLDWLINFVKRDKVELLILESLHEERLTLFKIKDWIVSQVRFVLEKAQAAFKVAIAIPGMILEYIQIGVGIVIKNLDTWATHMNNTAQKVNSSSRLYTAIVLAATTVMLIAQNVVMWLSTIATWLMTAATWAWNISLYANPIVLVVAAVVLGIVAMAVFAIKIGEQISLWDRMKLVISHIFGMFKWGFDLVANFFISIGQWIWNVLEGPLFKFGMFFSHFFKMIMWYAAQIGHFLMENLINPIIDGFKWIWQILNDFVIQPLMSFFSGIWQAVDNLRNPFFTLKDILTDAFTPVMNLFESIWGFISSIIDGVADLGSTVISAVMEYIGYAEGGYVRPMANGGLAHHGPYMVGEKGPELFMPEGAGRIVANKDLNTQRVNNMLTSAFESSSDVDRSAGIIQSQQLIVSELTVKEAKLGKSRIGIDSFAGGM